MKANRNRPVLIPLPQAGDTELIELDARRIGTLLDLLEDAKTPGRWGDPDIALDGYQYIIQEQEAMLMGIGDRLIRELRAMRDGVNTPLAERDPALDPFTLELTCLRDIEETQIDPAGTTAAILARLEQLQIAANDGDAEALGELFRIGAIIAGVPTP